MGKIQKINDYLDIPLEKFEKLEIFNPFMGIDTHLFLDPALLRKTNIKEFKESYKKITSHFVSVMKLLMASKHEKDIAWKEAYRRLLFKETRGISIGYGANTGDGNAIGPELAAKMTHTASQILKMDIQDPAVFELICLFEEGLGADRLSDMVISIIKRDIFAYTHRVLEELKVKKEKTIQVKYLATGETFNLIKSPFSKRPLLLLPRKLLKDLPLALARDDIGYIVYFNDELRRKVSGLLLGDTMRSLKDLTKKEYKEIFLNKESIEKIVVSYKSKEAEEYDFKNDPKGEFLWHEKGREAAEKFPLEISKKHPKTLEDVKEIVGKIIAQFKRNIEQNELYELLYKEPTSALKPRHERYAQRLFYSIADAYCGANNIVLSREPNAGNGPVDFKVASDYRTQVLVEIKLSSGHVRNGFQKQLPEYQKNENAQHSVLVVIKVTQTSKQIDDVERIRDEAIKEKKQVPELVIIDAMPRESASKSNKKK